VSQLGQCKTANLKCTNKGREEGGWGNRKQEIVIIKKKIQI
jgi:hypothetical protein